MRWGCIPKRAGTDLNDRVVQIFASSGAVILTERVVWANEEEAGIIRG